METNDTTQELYRMYLAEVRRNRTAEKALLCRAVKAETLLEQLEEELTDWQIRAARFEEMLRKIGNEN